MYFGTFVLVIVDLSLLNLMSIYCFSFLKITGFELKPELLVKVLNYFPFKITVDFLGSVERCSFATVGDY